MPQTPEEHLRKQVNQGLTKSRYVMQPDGSLVPADDAPKTSQPKIDQKLEGEE